MRYFEKALLNEGQRALLGMLHSASKNTVTTFMLAAGPSEEVGRVGQPKPTLDGAMLARGSSSETEFRSRS